MDITIWKFKNVIYKQLEEKFLHDLRVCWTYSKGSYQETTNETHLGRRDVFF